MQNYPICSLQQFAFVVVVLNFPMYITERKNVLYNGTTGEMKEYDWFHIGLSIQVSFVIYSTVSNAVE